MDPMSILLFAMFGLLIFMMMRKQKKPKAAAEEKRSKLAPGVGIMTNFGLFGPVLSIDTDENKILMEISPGTTATVHSQTVAKIIDPADAQDVEAIVPNDASSLTLNLDKQADATESVEESLERLKNENNKDN